MLANNRMTYNSVLITCFNNRSNQYTCDNVAGYNNHLEENPNMVEDIGKYGQQIKPVFDIDAYDSDIIMNEVIADINKVFPNKSIYYAKRDPREYKGKMKYSYCFYVDGVRITSKNLKALLISNGFDKNKIYDMSIYDKNKVLFLPLTTNKTDNTTIPALVPIDCDIFKCCASYIQEDFEDWDAKFQDEEPKSKKDEPVEVQDDEDDDENPNKYERLTTLIKKLKPSRSDDFDNWIKMCWCIMNICDKEKISRRKCCELVHLFSKLSKDNYDEDKVDEWFDKNFEKRREQGFGWVYLLHTCIKEDDPKYYENISQSYSYLKKEFEKINCKILYPPMIVHKDRKGENDTQPIPLCEKTNRHLECIVKETNKKDEVVYKKKRFIELWLNDPTIRRYEKFVFTPPPLKVENYEYNTWTDFDILKTPYIPDVEIPKRCIIQRFIEYMKNLLNDDNVVNYILAYFANRIQNPAKRNMVCIILYGEEGDGKNRLFDTFRNIFGQKYFAEIETAKKMFGTHSCIEKEKLFICLNEARGKDNYENSEILKSRITTDTLIVNPKGIQEFKIDNYCDYLMTTNNMNAVNIHDKSRRYLYVETTSCNSRNTEFFNAFSDDIVENPEALRVFYEYLKAFDVKAVIPTGNFQNHIPETEIQKTIIKNNRDKILYFLEDLTNDYFFDDGDNEIKLKNQQLFDKWNNWIDKTKTDVKYNNIAFNTRLGMLMKKQINKDAECIEKDTHCNTIIYVSKLKEFFVKLNQ